MHPREPQTREGQIWVGAWNEALAAFVQSGERDVKAFEDASRSLTNLFERCPDVGEFVAHLALSGCVIADWNGAEVDLRRLTGIGTEAGWAVVDGSPGHRLRSAAIALFDADAELAAGRPFAAADSVARAEEVLATRSNEDSVLRFLRAWKAYTAGRLAEASLERRDADAAYAEAAALSGQLLGDERAFAEATAGWAGLLWSGNGAPDQFAEMLSGLLSVQITRLHLLARIGRTKVPHNDADPRARAQEAWRAMLDLGLPAGVDPIDLREMVAALAPDDADRAATALLRAAEDADDWVAVLGAAAGRSYAAAGDLKTAEELFLGAARTAARCGDAFAVAVALGDVFVHKYRTAKPDETEVVDGLAEALLGAVNAVPATGTMDEPRRKAILEGAVGTAIAWAFDRHFSAPSTRSRVVLGLLLDVLRQPHWLNLPSQKQAGRSDAAHGLLAALDWLGRVERALGAHPDTAAAVIQSVGEDTLFVVVANDGGVVGATAGAGYRSAAAELARRLREEGRYAAALGGDVEDTLAEPAQAAYQQLPKPVRQAIEAHQVLIVVPDFSSMTDQVPYETLHDGIGYLGQRRIVARASSIQMLLRTLETGAGATGRRRALVAAATEDTGEEPLPYADAEAEEVRTMLSGHGWDAPAVAQERLCARYLLDRLPFVSVCHIAAHGTVVGGQEQLLLPHGTRLVPQDVLRDRLKRLPFTYLNTCSLGETRYLGGGVATGVAYTLLQRGAPAVVANLTMVADEAVSKLAESFYDSARTQPVGEALRLARNGDVVAALWGSTVLMGDPWLRLAGSGISATPAAPGLGLRAESLLDAYVTPDRAAASGASGIALAAEAELSMGRSDPRLEAALCFVKAAANATPAELVALAAQLNHAPSLAYARIRLLEAAAGDLAASERLALTDAALDALEPLRGTGWDGIRGQILLTKRRLELAAQGFVEQVLGPAEPDDAGLNAAKHLQELLLIQQASADERYGPVTVRATEETVEDIAWNAVVRNHPNRFEGMPETAAYAAVVARRLAQHGWIAQESLPWAPIVLAGVLRYVWNQMDSPHLQAELVQGFTQAVADAVADIRRWWSPPAGAWLRTIRSYASLVDEATAALDAAPWDEQWPNTVQTHRDRLTKAGHQTLAKLRSQHTEQLASSTGFLLGTLVTKNRYSPWDGSTHEDIAAALTEVYTNVSGKARYDEFYLTPAFDKVRGRRNELDRWQAEGF